METVKKHKVMVVGLLAASILAVLALIAYASTEKPLAQNEALQQKLTIAGQEVKTCPANAAKPCCKTENGDKTCPANCTKPCCTAKNAEENVKACPLSTPKSCCTKN